MSGQKKFLEKWKTEYNFKTLVSATVSLAVSVIFALYNGFLGVYHRSLWYGTICVYYILLVILRGTIAFTVKKIPRQETQRKTRNRIYLVMASLLLILNCSLIVPVSLMVRQQTPVNLTLIPAISMAAYTTYKAILASVNLKKSRKASDGLVRLLRTISFIDALVSILTLQNTLIMVHANGADIGMKPMTAATGAVVWAAVLFLPVSEILNGIRVIKGTK